MQVRPQWGRLGRHARQICQNGRNATSRSSLMHQLVPHQSRAFQHGSTPKQAVQVPIAKEVRLESSPSAQLCQRLETLEQLFSTDSSIASSTWARRASSTKQRWRSQSQYDPAASSARNQVLITGSSLSQVQHMLTTIIDEPLRDAANGQTNDAQIVAKLLDDLPPSTPLTVRYGAGGCQPFAPDGITLDRHWLQRSNLQLVVLIDPTISESTFDLVYDSQAVFFVTDDYALRQSLHRASTRATDASACHQLIARFSAKPNVYTIVNKVVKQGHGNLLEALEAATSPLTAELLAPRFIMVSATEAEAAQHAFRQALSDDAAKESSSSHWDAFSSQYRQSNVGTIIDAFQTLAGDAGISDALLTQSTTFLLQHGADEALSKIRLSKLHLHEIDALARVVANKDEETVQNSLERIWPAASIKSGQLKHENSKIWRPASAGSASAVDEAFEATSKNLERTFDKRLQWWKMIWKLDDVRAELEVACNDFAKSLESDLAYESGRLATIQVHQDQMAEELLARFRVHVNQLTSISPSIGKDAVLLANEADAYRSSQQTTIEPSTLMEPIHRRRAQLLRVGGPIDVLASKTRKLALSTSVAAIAATAGLGSAGVLGSSLITVDASAASLALEPHTALGLGLLTFTLAGWRLQGQYNKYRSRFRRDWDRLSEGLDSDLRQNFEHVLRQKVTGPGSFVSSRILNLTQDWSADINRQDSLLKHSSLLDTTATPQTTADSMIGSPPKSLATHSAVQ